MPEYAIDLNGLAGLESDRPPTVISADGAIPVRATRLSAYALNHAAGAMALTLAAPGPADDGKILWFTGEDTVAHVITSPVDGFNHKGAAGTATWSGITQGDSLMIVAHAGSWWTLSKNVVVVA